MLYKFQNVSFSYNKDKTILDSVNLEIQEDQIILLNGHNGSGKTTFCRLLTGLISSYEGSLLFENKELRNQKVYEVAERVLYLKQESIQNIIAATAVKDLEIRQNKLTKNDDDLSFRKREDAMNQVNLSSQQNTPTWELSSGQLKRIGLASLPLFSSHFWILDEPFLGLDSNSIDIVTKWLIERRKLGLGALIINHLDNLDDTIYHISYNLQDGKLVKIK